MILHYYSKQYQVKFFPGVKSAELEENVYEILNVDKNDHLVFSDY